MRGASVARHPDLDYIISLAKKGNGARGISKIINDKYRNGPAKYRLSWICLNDFMNNVLHLSKEDRAQLKALAKQQGESFHNEKDLAIQAKIQSKISIVEMQETLAENRVDVQEELEKLFETATTEIDDINARVKAMKSDRDFAMGKSTVIASIEQVRKILIDIKQEQVQMDNSVNNNRNVVIQFGHVDAYVKVMKQALVETFRELGYLKELPVFLGKLSEKMEKINTIEIKDASGASISVSNQNGMKAIDGGNNG